MAGKYKLYELKARIRDNRTDKITEELHSVWAECEEFVVPAFEQEHEYNIDVLKVINIQLAEDQPVSHQSNPFNPTRLKHPR